MIPSNLARSWQLSILLDPGINSPCKILLDPTTCYVLLRLLVRIDSWEIPLIRGKDYSVIWEYRLVKHFCYYFFGLEVERLFFNRGTRFSI